MFRNIAEEAAALASLALFAGGPLVVDQQANPVLEAEVGELGRAELSLEGLGHGGQVHGGHLLDGGVHEHRVSFLREGWATQRTGRRLSSGGAPATRGNGGNLVRRRRS